MDIEDSLALCLARDGERQSFSILETPNNVQIVWEAQYIIDGERFVVTTTDDRVRTIVGYPTREIENSIKKCLQ